MTWYLTWIWNCLYRMADTIYCFGLCHSVLHWKILVHFTWYRALITSFFVLLLRPILLFLLPRAAVRWYWEKSPRLSPPPPLVPYSSSPWSSCSRPKGNNPQMSTASRLRQHPISSLAALRRQPIIRLAALCQQPVQCLAALRQQPVHCLAALRQQPVHCLAALRQQPFKCLVALRQQPVKCLAALRQQPINNLAVRPQTKVSRF